MTVTVRDNLDTLLPKGVLIEAAARGVENAVIAHLRARSASRPPNPFGLPKSNYWADAAKDVSTAFSGTHATVSVMKPGAALHYFGGTVLPKKKALAVPVDPSVATVWPSEYTRLGHSLFRTPGGALGDPETGRILYILLRSATLKPDPTVLPSPDTLAAAARSAATEALS